MPRTWIDLTALSALIALSGCATHKQPVLPHGERTMLDIWDSQTAGASPSDPAGRQLLEARQTLRRPLDETEVISAQTSDTAYTRNASNEIYRQFHRLPNPDLIMYVFPHLSGTEPVPVPGYSTVFPFYQRVQYAMPGEPGEDE